MKANEVTLTSFLSQTKTQFVIPVYQRNYDWQESQCLQLLEDIIEVGQKDGETHFIGSVVFIYDGVYSTSEVRPLVVIDGQQRLTTISLLYMALHRYAVENDLPEKADEINDTFLTNKYVKNDSSKLKLKQTDSNAKAFKYLLAGENPANYGMYSKVIENFTFFKEQLNSGNFETVLKGLNSLLFVEISLERGKDDPQRIFESLNSTGLELSQADLIRNYILMGLEPTAQTEVFESIWEVIESNAKDKSKEESKVSDFIRDYLTLKNKKIPNKNRVYEDFKGLFGKRDALFYSRDLKEIRDFSFFYCKLLNYKDEADLEIRQQLRLVKKLEINVCFPFMMAVYNDYQKKVISKNDFLGVFSLIQSFTWRRFTVDLPTNALNKIFMTLYGEVEPERYLESIEEALVKKKGTQRFPTDGEVKAALRDKDMYNIQSKNRQYCLEMLENYNNKEFVSIENPNLTIEHVFPQNPDNKWKSVMNEEEYSFMKERSHTITNLTLSGNNGSLGNKTFTEKKIMNNEGGEQGYNFSSLWLNRFFRELENWNPDSYQKRYEQIELRFLSIWRYPKVNITSNSTEIEEFTIVNAPEPVNRKLEYFVFMDERVEANEFAKMYFHVIKKLFEKNPSLFLETVLVSILPIKTDPKELRTPYKVHGNYYVESNLGNLAKFTKLKQVLTICECEDELVFCYTSNYPS